jgi:hypothetical protein
LIEKSEGLQNVGRRLTRVTTEDRTEPADESSVHEHVLDLA